MTIRNAFANLITESFSGAIEALANRIAAAVDNLDDREYRRGLVETPRALQYARDINDRLRVSVDANAAINTIAAFSGNTTNTKGTTLPAGGPAALFTPWFDGTAIYMVDEREQQRVQSEQQINAVRQGRWVIT